MFTLKMSIKVNKLLFIDTSVDTETKKFDYFWAHQTIKNEDNAVDFCRFFKWENSKTYVRHKILKHGFVVYLKVKLKNE